MVYSQDLMQKLLVVGVAVGLLGIANAYSQPVEGSAPPEEQGEIRLGLLEGTCFATGTGTEAGPSYVPGFEAGNCTPSLQVYRNKDGTGFDALVIYTREGDVGNPERKYKYPDGKEVYFNGGIYNLHGSNYRKVVRQAREFMSGLRGFERE